MAKSKRSKAVTARRVKVAQLTLGAIEKADSEHLLLLSKLIGCELVRRSEPRYRLWLRKQRNISQVSHG
jgi:hypothetical protein